MSPAAPWLALALAAPAGLAAPEDLAFIVCQAAREQQLIENRWREFEYLKDERKVEIEGGKAREVTTVTRRVHRLEDGIAVNETVAVDGQALPVAEAARQRQRYRDRVAELEDPSVRSRELARARAEREAKASTMAAIGQAFHLRLEGLDWVGGEPAYVVSFVPQPGFRPSTRDQATFQKMQGVAWIRVERPVFLRLEADFIDSASVKLGPFAVIKKGSHFLLQQEDVEPGVPMARSLELDLGLRLFLIVNRLERRGTYYRELRRVRPPWPAFVP